MTATTRDYIDIVTGYYPPAGPVCEAGDTYEDRDGYERSWSCSEPGTITVDDTLMCLRHAGQLGYGPEQAEYGFNPDDGLNPTPDLTEEAGQ
jgi:hypothetical protein